MSDYNFSWYILLAALFPVLVLLYLIWKRDKYQREPIRMILLAFAVGTLSVPLSMTVSIPNTLFWEAFFLDWIWAPITCFYDAFFEAAIPEELAKFAILCLFLHKNKYYNEYMDGIVYAAAIGLGFAGLENIMYVASEEESWGTVALFRALLSVPGHFAYGVVMGYYYSLWRIENDRKSLFYAMAIPILFHGAYDFVLMFVSTTGFVTGGIIVAFFVGIHNLRKHCTELIDKHLDNDLRSYFPKNENQYNNQFNLYDYQEGMQQSGFANGPMSNSGYQIDKDLTSGQPMPVNEEGFVNQSGFIAPTDQNAQTYQTDTLSHTGLETEHKEDVKTE